MQIIEILIKSRAAEACSLLTVRSRNGCDQMNSIAESIIAARVRSDLLTFKTDSGATRGREVLFILTDMMSVILYKTSVIAMQNL